MVKLELNTLEESRRFISEVLDLRQSTVETIVESKAKEDLVGLRLFYKLRKSQESVEVCDYWVFFTQGRIDYSRVTLEALARFIKKLSELNFVTIKPKYTPLLGVESSFVHEVLLKSAVKGGLKPTCFLKAIFSGLIGPRGFVDAHSIRLTSPEPTNSRLGLRWLWRRGSSIHTISNVSMTYNPGCSLHKNTIDLLTEVISQAVYTFVLSLYINNPKPLVPAKCPEAKKSPSETEAEAETEEVKKETVCFISGKVSGLDYQVVSDKFKDTADFLRESGMVPLNPLNHVTPDMSWEASMEITLALLKDCDMIYMISGWQDSKGARKELETFLSQNDGKILFEH